MVTVPQMAQQLGRSVNWCEYRLLKLHVVPVSRVGRVRLYSDVTVDLLRVELLREQDRVASKRAG